MVEILEVTPSIALRRAKWRYNGAERPDFAEPVAEGQESVWDYPRPPRVEPVVGTIEVSTGGQRVAHTCGAVRVCETAGAPTYYFPPEDVAGVGLHPTGAVSVCEWKGVAQELSLDGMVAAGWRYLKVYPEYRALCRWVAFYPFVVDCYVGEERVAAQPGGYYGGWVTSNLAGPIKGLPGSEGW